VTRKAVRVYEAKGLLPSTQRAPSGYRLYDHHDIELLTFIRRARRLGLHLDDIRDVLSIHASGQPPCATVRALLDDRIAEIDSTIAELRALRTTLADIRHRADGSTDQHPAAFCAIIEEA
jgi:MerR family copper efflux transcriptional regulator